MKTMKRVTLLVGMLSLLAVSAQAAWYTCKITNITPKANGSVAVRFVPGTAETRFTELSRGEINPAEVGAKNMLATLLTAVSLNKEVTLDMTVVPSMTYQDIYGVSLTIE